MIPLVFTSRFHKTSDSSDPSSRSTLHRHSCPVWTSNHSTSGSRNRAHCRQHCRHYCRHHSLLLQLKCGGEVNGVGNS